MRRATLATNTQTVLQGTVVAADIAVVLDAGSASVDLSSATIPRNYQGHILRVYDANNVDILGYVGGNGTGTIQKIFTRKGGTTQNWAAQGAGFDDTTNCRYEILKVADLKEVTGFGGAATAANAHVSTVAANAFFFYDGWDFAPYQDGRHFIRLKDAAGIVAWSKIKAAVPGGLNSTEKVANPELTTNTSGWLASAYTASRVASTSDPGANSGGADEYCLKGVATGTAGRALYRSVTLAVGSLVKYMVRYYTPTGNPAIFVSLGLPSVAGSVKDAWTALSSAYYTTVTTDPTLAAGNLSAGGAIGNTVYLDSFSVPLYTIPPATGVILVNNAGGRKFYQSADDLQRKYHSRFKGLLYGG